LTESTSGSGFFVDGGDDGRVVVTNAHVVGSYSRVQIEWMTRGSFTDIRGCDADLVGIDYVHDLAILTLDGGETGPSLKLGQSPAVGDEVWICGYPFGVETPRLSRGLISGYDTTSQEVCGVVLDGAVNSGNSGGPVCDGEGRVVGVISARHCPVDPRLLEAFVGKDPELLDDVMSRIQANAGIGYALDPVDVDRTLQIRKGWVARSERMFETCPPKEVAMPREDFVSLQRGWADLGSPPPDTSPIGVFSFDGNGQCYAGWFKDEGKVSLPTSPAWRRIVAEMSPAGGSFFLDDYEIWLYRQKYQRYVVPVRLAIR